MPAHYDYLHFTLERGRTYALVGPTELAGACQYSATVHKYRKTESFTVLQRECFRREFG